MMFLIVALAIGAAIYFLYLGGNVDQAVVQKIAQAIATAEGFYVAGSRPARDHNPGDMTQDLTGKSTGRDGIFVVYDNDQDGWDNLYAQIEKWLGGDSANANASSTISDISKFYTTTQQDIWANNVASVLGVDPDTQIGNIS